MTNQRQICACFWPFTDSSPQGKKRENPLIRINGSPAQIYSLAQTAASHGHGNGCLGRGPACPGCRDRKMLRMQTLCLNPSAEVEVCTSYYSCLAAAAATPSFQNNIFSNEVAENSFTFLLSLPAQNKKCLCCHYLIQSSGVHWIPTGYKYWKKLTCILINNAIQCLNNQASGNALCFVHYLL